MVYSLSQIKPPDESNGDAAVFCTGLPFVGWRDLSASEQELLNQEARTDFIYSIVWLVLAGVSIIAPLSVVLGLSFVIPFSPFTEDVLAALIIAASLLGFTISLILADRAFRRSRITKRTLSQGRFRIFKGDFDNEDPTDHEREQLVKSGALGMGQSESVTLELHAVDDVIFAKNGSRLRKWIAVELTTAASLPQNAARYNVPSEWEIPSEDNLLRRRLTSNEKEELLNYARPIRKWRWLQILLGIWVAASLVRMLGNLTGLQTETAIQLWLMIAISGSGIWYYRQDSKARIFDEDAELGWAIVFNAESASEIVEKHRAFTADVEVLAASGLIWVVKGKPAGWRRKKKEV